MIPTLEPGDRILCVALPRRIVLTQGAVVVAKDPRDPRSLLVKRIKAIDPNGQVHLAGDNEGVSIDSRHFGTVETTLIEGRALLMYAPKLLSLIKR